jgi:hypothetical protein
MTKYEQDKQQHDRELEELNNIINMECEKLWSDSKFKRYENVVLNTTISNKRNTFKAGTIVKIVSYYDNINGYDIENENGEIMRCCSPNYLDSLTR